MAASNGRTGKGGGNEGGGTGVRARPERCVVRALATTVGDGASAVASWKMGEFLGKGNELDE